MAKYRLKALLDIKERAEQAAKDELGRAQAALRAQLDVLEEMERELERMIEDRKRRREEYSQKLASGEMKITEQSAAYRYIDRMKEQETDQAFQIEGQREVIRNAEKDVKRAQDALIVASQELKAIQKHQEKWLAERKKERQAREELMMDEIGQTIFQQQRKK